MYIVYFLPVADLWLFQLQGLIVQFIIFANLMLTLIMARAD
jgi:hypothetical protein